MTKEMQSPGGFSQLISDCFPGFTKSEKRIAAYLEQNQNEAAFLTSVQMAERLHLSEATIIRFARTLGFDSYPAMRVALQENFRRRMTHSVRLRSRLEDLHSDGDIFERLVASEIDFLTEAVRTVDRKALHAAVELLRTHDRVFVFGLGPSISLVDLLEIRLTRSARHVIPLSTTGREMLEPLLLMQSSDLIIAFGFFSFSPQMQLVLEHAARRKTPVILITDTLGPLVSDMAQVILAAPRGPVSMTIVNALLLELSSVDQERVMANLDDLDQLRESLKKSYSSSPK